MIHNLSKFYDVPFGLVTPPFISSVLLYNRWMKGGYYSTSDDLSCSYNKRYIISKKNLIWVGWLFFGGGGVCNFSQHDKQRKQSVIQGESEKGQCKIMRVPICRESQNTQYHLTVCNARLKFHKNLSNEVIVSKYIICLFIIIWLNAVSFGIVK